MVTYQGIGVRRCTPSFSHLFYISMIRVLLTGGGSGGHIYPLLAVTEEFEKMPDVNVQLSYLGPRGPFDAILKEKDITVYSIASSKLRRYFSVANFIDVPKLFLSFFQSLYWVYKIMPDVVFSKGGPGAFPVVLAARFYFIPVIIQDSDAVPGLTNRLCGHFATRIAVSFPETVKYFPKSKTAVVGNPIRKEIMEGAFRKEQAREYFKLNPLRSTILVLGGSQGAAQINSFIFNNLKVLIEDDIQIIHQVGPGNKREADDTVRSLQREIGEQLNSGYSSFELLDVLQYKNAFSAADIVLSRSGSTIFEIAFFGKASILVPLESAANDHQRANAYSYARSGAAVVLEKENFTPHIVLSKIKELLSHADMLHAMELAAKNFSRPNAAKEIAEEIITFGLRK